MVLVRDGVSQLQAHHASQTLQHRGGAIFVWGCMTSCGMGSLQGNGARYDR